MKLRCRFGRLRKRAELPVRWFGLGGERIEKECGEVRNVVEVSGGRRRGETTEERERKK